VFRTLSSQALPANGAASVASTVDRVDFKTAAARVLGAFLITRFFIFLIGYLSSLVILKDKWFPKSTSSLVDLFFTWDSGWYISIVEHGYQFHPGKESNVVFFPLYPLMVKLLALIFSVRLAGFIISNVALFLAVTYFYRLILLDYEDTETADKAVWYLLVSPVSFFFSIFYTEGLFLFLVIASFYHARKKAWLIASLLGLLASLTRSLGVFLIIPLLTEYFDVAYDDLAIHLQKIRKDILYLFCIPMGLFSYMGYLYFAFGDAFAFSHASSVWHRRFVLLTTTFRNIQHYPHFYKFIFFGSIIIGILLLGFVIYQRIRISYIVYYTLFMFLYLSSNLLDSIPRYISVLFPLYIGLALLAHKNAHWNQFITIFSIMFLTLFTILFTNGYWMT
jgi:Gpi18-like mannosyltransferase